MCDEVIQLEKAWYPWLKQKPPSEMSLKKAVEQFNTFSHR